MSTAFNIDSDDIGSALRKRLENYKPQTASAQVGRVVEVGDLTIALAEKVVERSLDDATNRQLIDNYINNLGNGSN